jgi:hypothetical protein
MQKDLALVEIVLTSMSDALCTKYGCDYKLDLDGQVTCSNCGAMGDDMPNPQSGYSTGKWSDDDDWSPITPIFGPNR